MKPIIVYLLALVTVLITTVTGAAEPGPAPEDMQDLKSKQPVLDTTRYIQPLQRNDANLKAIRKDIMQLRMQPDAESASELEERAAAAQKLGEKFLTEGRRFHKNVKSFLRGQTRHGLDLEIDLIRENVSQSHEMLVQYRHLVGASVTPLGDNDEVSLKRQIQILLEQELRKRIAARLNSEGLRDLILNESWLEIRNKAVTHLRDKLQKTLEQETQRVFGMAFHDRRSAQRALKQRINRHIEKEVAKMLIRITSNELVIVIAGHIVVNWLKDALWNRIWPKIRESFRGKGNLEPRVERSLKTLSDARLKLMSLKRDARLKAVEKTIKDARVTIHATRYLLKDLERAKRDALYKQMLVGIYWLEHAVSFNRKRFLMHKEAAVLRLNLDREVLEDTLKELEKILRGVDKPDFAKDKQFFLYPYERLTAEGIEKFDTGGARSTRACGISSITLNYIDLLEVERYRDTLRKRGSEDAELPLYDLSRKSSRIVRRYDGDYVMRTTANSQSRYTYVAAGTQRWGGSHILGLTPGTHKIAYAVFTSDGFRYEGSFSCTTTAVTKEEARKVESYRNNVEEVKKRLANATETKDEINTMRGLYFELGSRFGTWFMWGGALPGDLEPLLTQQMQIADYLYQARYDKARSEEIYTYNMANVVERSKRVGDAKLYPLAQKAANQAEAMAASVDIKHLSGMAGMYRRLANLAIASSNDVEGALEYLEKSLDWRIRTGGKVDEARERERWPVLW